MISHRWCLILALFAVPWFAGRAASPDLAAFPRPVVKDPLLQIELLSAEPDLVTPIGCAVDRKGRIFVVESHTHFPKPDYAGPKSDRILIFSGVAGEKPTVFAGDLRWAMNLVFGPNGRLYVSHRNGVLRLDDADGDGVSESRASILRLETAGTYPHNGIGGLAVANDGTLYVGVGENLGLPYTLVGTNGSRISVPAGAGGRIFRCRPDGSGLEQMASGFWNPFGLTLDRSARLLAVDNDPDSRPPCRLLHVIPGGFYGFQFRHGRDGLSPFIAWDGELVGSLPMAAGTGEGPTSLIDLGRTSLPTNYLGSLLVAASWDHTLEVYRRTPVGISFKASREILVEGGEDFRPVALAIAPDGSVVFTDWVKQDYNVHSHGRLWRLSIKDPALANVNRRGAVVVSQAERAAMQFHSADPSRDFSKLRYMLREPDPFIRSIATAAIADMSPVQVNRAFRWFKEPIPAAHCLLALRQSLIKTPTGTNAPPGLAEDALRYALRSPDPGVRITAITWVVEDRIVSLVHDVEASLHAGPVTPLLLAAHAEALKQLRGTNDPSIFTTLRVPEAVTVLPLAVPDAVQATQALGRLADPAQPVHQRLAALRLLSGQHSSSLAEVLHRIAVDTTQASSLRADAILGLTGGHEDQVSDLAGLLNDSAAEVALETARALRPWVSKPAVKAAFEAVKGPPAVLESAAFALGRRAGRPVTDAEWRQRLDAGTGDPDSGRRVFYSAWAACSKCHRIEGQGGTVGPDLSTIARAANREKLLLSMLHPSRDIAPQFAQHQIETRGGETYAGRVLSEGADGSITLVTGEGQAVFFPKNQIASDRILTLSMMPDGLVDGMTIGDFRDLLVFLENRR